MSPSKRCLACQGFVYGGTQRIDVGSLIEHEAKALLRAHIVRTAEDISCFGEVMGLSIGCRHHLGDTEIHHFNPGGSTVFVGDDYIGRLHIAMDNAFLMGIGEGFGD